MNIIILYKDNKYLIKDELDLTREDVCDSTLLLIPMENKKGIYIPIIPHPSLWFTKVILNVKLVMISSDYNEDNFIGLGNITIRKEYNSLTSFVNGLQLFNNISALYKFYDSNISLQITDMRNLCINTYSVDFYYGKDKIYHVDSGEYEELTTSKAWSDFVYNNLDRVSPLYDILVKKSIDIDFLDYLTLSGDGTWLNEPTLKDIQGDFLLAYAEMFSVFIYTNVEELEEFNACSISLSIMECEYSKEELRDTVLDHYSNNNSTEALIEIILENNTDNMVMGELNNRYQNLLALDLLGDILIYYLKFREPLSSIDCYNHIVFVEVRSQYSPLTNKVVLTEENFIKSKRPIQKITRGEFDDTIYICDIY